MTTTQQSTPGTPRITWAPSRRTFVGKWKGANGWKTVSVPVAYAHDPAAAAAWFAEWCVAEQTRNPWPVRPPTVTLRTLVTTWLDWKRARVDSRLFADCERTVRLYVLSDPMSDIPIADLTTAHAAAYVERLQAEHGHRLAPMTVRNIIAGARSLISDLRGIGLINIQNPFADPFIRRMFRRPPRRSGDCIVHMKPPEIRTLIESCPQRRCLYAVAYGTGMRIGELAGLQWGDVSLDEGLVHVRRQLFAFGDERRMKPPKRGSRRVIPLHTRVVDELRAHYDSAVSSGGAAPGAETLVFRDIPPRASLTLRADLKRARLSTDCEGNPLTFHALRRSFMSSLHSQGVAVDIIGILAGHAATGVTHRCYVSADVRPLRAAIAQLPWGDP